MKPSPPATEKLLDAERPFPFRRPLRRSAGFWLGVIVMVCLAGGWWDSRHYQTISRLPAGAEVIHVIHGRSGITLQSGGVPPAAMPPGNMVRSTHDSGWISMPRFQFMHERFVHLPYWLLSAFWLALWAGWLGLRYRRKRVSIAAWLGAPTLFLLFFLWIDSTLNWMSIGRGNGGSHVDVWSRAGALRLEYARPPVPIPPGMSTTRMENAGIDLDAYLRSKVGREALYPPLLRTEAYDTTYGGKVRRIDLSWRVLLLIDAAFWMIFLVVPACKRRRIPA